MELASFEGYELDAAWSHRSDRKQPNQLFLSKLAPRQPAAHPFGSKLCDSCRSSATVVEAFTHHDAPRFLTFCSVSKPLIIGIAGGSGSGKSTVATNVADALTSLSVAFIDMDAYYRNFTRLSLEERRHLNWDHPDAFDYDLLTDHLERLARRETIEKPVYDFVTHLRSSETVAVEPSDVIVIDGILLFVDERVRDLCDVKVFVDADADIRLIRRIERDMSARGRPLPEIIEQYLSTVQPMHLQFVEPSKRYADIIVPRGGHNSVAIEMIVAKIRQRLGYAAGTPALQGSA